MGPRTKYSAAELAFIKRHKTMPRKELHEAFVKHFGRSEVSLLDIRAVCRRKRWLTGRSGAFKVGHAPFIKGRKDNPNLGRIGRETIYNGFVHVIVEQTDPRSPGALRPVRKHRMLWEKANGPLPPGMALKCIDGNKLNTDPSNWESVPRSLLFLLNGARRGCCEGRIPYDKAPNDLKPTIMAIAKLEHELRQKDRRP